MMSNDNNNNSSEEKQQQQPPAVSSGKTTPTHLPICRLPQLLASAQSQLRRIDALEQQVAERTTRVRRRFMALLDSHSDSTTRKSHLRCYVTHACHNNANNSDNNSPIESKVWVLRLEGQLLIPHLDHTSAQDYDKKNKTPSSNNNWEDAPGNGGVEEPVPISPLQFSHLMEMIKVEFQTTYSPRPNPMARKKPTPPEASSPSKRQRKSSVKGGGGVAEDALDPRTLVVSAPTTLTWTKSTASGDAHAVEFQYPAPPPSEGRYQFHSVIAKVQLKPAHRYARQAQPFQQPPQPSDPPQEPTLYYITPKLARALFPGHVPRDESQASSTDSSPSAKKRKQEDLGPVPATEDHVQSPPPDHGGGLTMAQIASTFFTYLLDHNLSDTEGGDRSTMHCDDLLKELFGGGVEQFHFSSLQQMLLSRQLIRPWTSPGVPAPIHVTHILKEETATNYKDSAESTAVPSLLQFDMDVWVPSLFPQRVRQLLRRAKQREYDVFLARPKAAQLLMPMMSQTNEIQQRTAAAAAKAALDQAVARGRQYAVEHAPVHDALARAASPNTPAQYTSKLDAELCRATDRLQHQVVQCQDAWQRVAAKLPQGYQAQNAKHDNDDHDDQPNETTTTEPMQVDEKT